MRIEMLVDRNSDRERGPQQFEDFLCQQTELYRTPLLFLLTTDREDLSHQVFGPFPSREDTL